MPKAYTAKAHTHGRKEEGSLGLGVEDPVDRVDDGYIVTASTQRRHHLRGTGQGDVALGG